MRLSRFRSLCAGIAAAIALLSVIPAECVAQAADRDQAHDTGTVPTDPAHVLNPQDALRVQVFQEEEINRQCERLEVSQDCTITVPLIGVVNVRDKTIAQLQEMIRARLDKDFLVNPQVTVSVLQYADRWVNVIGSVTKQGKVQFPDVRDLSIVDAIALAGGQTRLADLKHVSLKRRSANGGEEVTEVDVNAMMKENSGQPVLLRPGDVIYVPERML